MHVIGLSLLTMFFPSPWWVLFPGGYRYLNSIAMHCSDRQTIIVFLKKCAAEDALVWNENELH